MATRTDRRFPEGLRTKEQRIDYALAQTRAGRTGADIARELHVSNAAVTRWFKEATHRRARERWTRDAIIERVRRWRDLHGHAPDMFDWPSREGRGLWEAPIVHVVDGEEWPTEIAVEAFFPSRSWTDSARHWHYRPPLAEAAKAARVKMYRRRLRDPA